MERLTGCAPEHICSLFREGCAGTVEMVNSRGVYLQIGCRHVLLCHNGFGTVPNGIALDNWECFYSSLAAGQPVRAEKGILFFPSAAWELQLRSIPKDKRILSPDKTPYLENETAIALHDRFFDNGPMLFEGMDAATVTLQSKKSGRFVEFGIEGFPNLCLWGMPTRMSLIAIEPWIGTSDRVDTDHIWEHKPGIQVVAMGEENVHTLTFRVG